MVFSRFRSILFFLAASSLLAGFWVVSRPTPTLPPQPFPPNRIASGVNIDLTKLDGAQLERDLQRLQTSGLTTVRQRFAWDRIEPQPQQFKWADFDRIVNAATRHGISLLATLDGSPAWARRPEDAQNSLAPPRERADFGRFVRAVAERYREKITQYEIWNEPNIAPHWGAQFVDPAAYAGLLREAYVNVKAADANARVLTAALAPNTESGGANLSDLAFLENLLDTGATGWFDAVAVQAFGFAEAPDAPASAERMNYRRVELMHAILEKRSLANVPVWIVATGWATKTTNNAETNASWPLVSSAEQATYATRANEIARQWPWLHGWLWAGYASAPQNDDRANFALIAPDGTPSPTFDALAARIKERATALTAGRYAPNAALLTYAGDWRASPLAADPSHNQNDALTFRFNGQRLDFDVQRGAYWAYFLIAVDGQPANALPRDENGNAYLILHDPTHARATVTLAENLPTGEHEVEVRAVGGWGQWPLLGITVYDQPTPTAPARTAGFALLGIGVVGLVASFAWPRNQQQTKISTEPTETENLQKPQRFADQALSTVLFLIPASLPFFLRPIAIGNFSFAATEVLTWVGVGLFLMRWLVEQFRQQLENSTGFARKTHPIFNLAFNLDVPVLIFFAVAAVSALGAAHEDVALRELRVLFLGGTLFYWLISRTRLAFAQQGISDARLKWWLLDGLAVAASVAAVAGLAQAIFGAGIIEAEGVGRVRAFYGSPNNLALFLERVLPMLVAVWVFGQGRRRWLYGGIALLATPALILTFSRGALILGLPAALIFVGIVRRGRLLRAVLAVLAAGVLGLIGVLLTGAARFAGLLDFQNGTSFLRLKLWRGAFNMALDFPWLGVGPDNFLYWYRTRYVQPTGWEELGLSHPHNFFLDLWTRLGVAGIFSGIWLWAATWRNGWRRYASLPEGADRAATLGLLAGLIAGLVHGLVDNSFFLVDLAYFFFLCAGLFAHQHDEAR